ncbi:hypothetical protein [Microbulbifer rhizosphaerae]|uniref:Flagellar biogenesis protein FliO n=1 Tax=Microbulbifer rhizosphaerae TaxID=1562603 RepID=A0A7W4WH50_9GAMM|nr:hypothetical protein [Microbulbifer rhizosphaerae]MBB3063501.1 hypothetical protein [Microbulbifer rhizosphaerae]
MSILICYRILALCIAIGLSCGSIADDLSSSEPGDVAMPKADTSEIEFKGDRELTSQLPLSYWVVLFILGAIGSVAWWKSRGRLALKLKSNTNSGIVNLVEKTALDSNLTAYILDIKGKKVLVLRQPNNLCLTSLVMEDQ